MMSDGIDNIIHVEIDALSKTAESAEKCRVGEPGYPTANGRQVKNGTGIEEIERGDLNLQVGTAKPGTETLPNPEGAK